MKTYTVSEDTKVQLGGEEYLLEAGDRIQIMSEEDLSYAEKQDLPDKSFVFPPTEDDSEGHYPIHDKSHADNARARASQLKKPSPWMKERGLSVKEVKDKVYSATEKFYKDEK